MLARQPDVAHCHATIFGALVIEGTIRNPMLPANIFDGHASLCLLEDSHDLFFGETTLFHTDLPF